MALGDGGAERQLACRAFDEAGSVCLCSWPLGPLLQS